MVVGRGGDDGFADAPGGGGGWACGLHLLFYVYVYVYVVFGLWINRCVCRWVIELREKKK